MGPLITMASLHCYTVHHDIYLQIRKCLKGTVQRDERGVKICIFQKLSLKQITAGA